MPLYSTKGAIDVTGVFSGNHSLRRSTMAEMQGFSAMEIQFHFEIAAKLKPLL